MRRRQAPRWGKLGRLRKLGSAETQLPPQAPCEAARQEQRNAVQSRPSLARLVGPDRFTGSSPGRPAAWGTAAAKERTRDGGGQHALPPNALPPLNTISHTRKRTRKHKTEPGPRQQLRVVPRHVSLSAIPGFGSSIKGQVRVMESCAQGGRLGLKVMVLKRGWLAVPSQSHAVGWGQGGASGAHSVRLTTPTRCRA